MGVNLMPCKGCRDRVVEPNCHMTCEKYLAYRAHVDRVREIKSQEKIEGWTKYS